MKDESKDRRVRRTKRLLREGLIQLMQQKPVRDISVKELSELIDINRGTFYLYYRDIFDMVQQLENELFEEMENIILQYAGKRNREGIASFFTDLLSFIKENSTMLKLLISPNGDNLFYERLNGAIREKYRTELRKTTDGSPASEFDHKYSFAIFGLIGLIHYWLEQDCRESVESLAATATEMTVSIFMIKEHTFTDARDILSVHKKQVLPPPRKLHRR